MTPPPEARESLVALVAGPVVWALHFAVSYATGAIWCAKAPATGLGGLHVLIGIYTGVALLLILLIARYGLRRHRFGDTVGSPHDAASAADRHRFLGFATLLLAGLSAVATLYVALAGLLTVSCW